MLRDENRRIAISVLRLSEGAQIELFDAKGQIASATIQVASKKEIRVEIVSLRRADFPSPSLTLIQGLPKGEKSSEVVQKGVECGISKIVFVEGEHAVARKGKGQKERWNRVAIEAMRQSGNPILPVIEGPFPLKEVLDHSSEEVRLLLDEKEEKSSIRNHLEKKATSIAIAVGPEGGWSDADRVLFRAAKFSPISVGPYTLRTETAAVFAMALSRAFYP